MRFDKILSVYNDKKEFIAIAKYPKDYIREMNKVFLDILGGEPQELTLTISNTKKITVNY